MKVVIKNNEVLSTYADNQNIYNLYPDCIFRKVFDGFTYTTPINEYNEEFKMNVDRYVIKNGDPDPMYNLTNVSLVNCRIIAGESISEEVNQYIQYKPATGEVRYTQAKQSSFTDIIMYCKDWLEDNPSATSEQKEPYETRITAINSARTWIRTVLNYYYDQVAIIRTIIEENWNTLTWDFSTFETSDPDVWLESVRI